MSNLNNNTTQLELLLAKVNALPEAGSGGTDTSDATATADKIFEGETAYGANGKVTGTFTIENELSAQEDLISQISTLVAQKASPSGGVELPDLTNPAAAADILSGKEAIDENGNVMTGTIATKTSSNLTASGATVTVPAGYYASNATKSVATATQATPSVSIDANGKISASATQTAGYVAAGTKTGTKQLTTQAAKTITPSTSSQTAVAKNVYTTGVVTVGAIPSSYENVATETTEYTSLISELTTAVSALETELEGKASGGGGGSSVPTCNILVTAATPDLSIENYAVTTFENNSYGQVYRIPDVWNFDVTQVSLNNVVCGSTVWIKSTAQVPLYTLDEGVTLLGTAGVGSIFQAPLIAGKTATIEIIDNS